MRGTPDERSARQLLDALDHSAFAVVEPLADEVPDRRQPVLLAELLEPALRDARRPQARQIVPVPLLGHADPPAAHADDVRNVLVIALNPYAREIERALFVDVARARHVRRREGIAAVRLVGFRAGREHVLPLVEDRDEDRVIGRVRVPEIRVVVEERVALRDLRVQLGHRLREELHPDDVDRQALRRRKELVLGRDERAGEVSRHVENGRAPGPQERVRHLAADAVQAVRKHGQQNGVEGLTGGGRHGAPPSRRPPFASSR